MEAFKMNNHPKSDKKPSILTLGVEPQINDLIQDILSLTDITPLPLESQTLESQQQTSPCVVISGPPKSGLKAEEVAQALRFQFPHSKIFFVSKSKQGFERADFINNGFNDAFLVPFDTQTLRNAISESLAHATNGAIRVFRPVKIVDIKAGTTLDFEVSVYMPVNKKFVKVVNKGDSFNEERIERFKKHNVNNIFVPSEQMPQFYSYTAEILRDLSNDNNPMAATQRREKLSEAVRSLISGLFSEHANSFEGGQAVLSDCHEIVKKFILSGAEGAWYSRILQVLGENANAYSHASNVSTLAALFSIGLGIGKPEDLAIAGLLHDIGIAELPEELQTIDYQNMTPGQKSEYEKHPEKAIELLKKRKIVLSETVTKAVLQHHEFYNGSGYPKGIYGDKISKEAYLLALADVFDEMTRMVDGKALMSPLQAVQRLRMEQVDNPSKILYQPEILKKLLSLFPAPSNA